MVFSLFVFVLFLSVLTMDFKFFYLCSAVRKHNTNLKHVLATIRTLLVNLLYQSNLYFYLFFLLPLSHFRFCYYCSPYYTSMHFKLKLIKQPLKKQQERKQASQPMQLIQGYIYIILLQIYFVYFFSY